MFKWLFGRKKQQPALEVEIVVKKVPYRDRTHEMLPFAETVLKTAPKPTGMTAPQLAEFASRQLVGKYIKVGEYPDGVDRDYVKTTIRNVVRLYRA